MNNTISEVQQLHTRAVRNVALCVIELQTAVPSLLFGDAVAHRWREKADRLRSAIRRAERFVELDNIDAAVILLRLENQPK